MVAPFPLPDQVTIFTPDGGAVIAFDVPCRVVPRWKEQDLLVTSGADTIKYGYQYWVDFEPDSFLGDGAGQWYSLAMQHGFSSGVLLEWQSSLALYQLRAVWWEERWTGTAKHHTRVYCRRESVSSS